MWLPPYYEISTCLNYSPTRFGTWPSFEACLMFQTSIEVATCVNLLWTSINAIGVCERLECGEVPSRCESILWRVVYTMDHKVVPRPCKICDWLLNSSWDHLGFTPRKKCHSGHKVWGPQKTYFNAYIIQWHGPTGFVGGETTNVL